MAGFAILYLGLKVSRRFLHATRGGENARENGRLQDQSYADDLHDPASPTLSYRPNAAIRGACPHPGQLTALPEHFKELNPKPLGGAPRDLVATGKKIYADGLPEANVPACAACHGPEAKGTGLFPRLAGQLNDYIFRKLTNWSNERGQDPANPDTSAIMEPIAHNLTEAQIAAVVAYVSYLE
jgi:cytochrome c553